MTVRRRKGSGRWVYDFRVGGRRHRSSIPEARTKAQAKQAEAKIRTEVFEGRYGRRPSSMTLSKFIEQVYLPWARVNKASWKVDEYRARRLREFLGARALSEITPFLIEKYKRGRSLCVTHLKTPVSAGTINNELKVLSRAFGLAVDGGLVHSNPCSRVRRLRGRDARTRYLSGEEEARLMAKLLRPTLRNVVLVALGTGMRQGEILSLGWRQVDFERGLLLVTNTKTGRDRQVPISSRVRAVLTEQRGRSKGELVFTNAAGGGLTKDGVGSAFRNACRAAGVGDFRFHDLRHTAATRMAEAGASAFDIKDLLGHSGIAMTARYAHATSEGKRRAVESLARGDGHSLVTPEFAKSG